MFIPDAFGWDFPNNRLLADGYARDGFLTYLPEFMAGNAVAGWVITKLPLIEGNPGFFLKMGAIATFIWHFIPFIIACRQSVCKPRIWEFCEKLRASEEAKGKGIGAAGFCWGGLWTFMLCGSEGKDKDGNWLIDAGFTAHPSNLSMPGDIEKVELPISVAAPELDMAMSTAKQEEMKKILEKKTERAEPECEVVDYPGAHHAFAIRGDEGEVAMDRMDKAKTQAVKWFEKCFAKLPST